MNRDYIKDFYVHMALVAHSKKEIETNDYKKILKLLCSKDADTFKLGTKKLKLHLWQ